MSKCYLLLRGLEKESPKAVFPNLLMSLQHLRIPCLLLAGAPTCSPTASSWKESSTCLCSTQGVQISGGRDPWLLGDVSRLPTQYQDILSAGPISRALSPSQADSGPCRGWQFKVKMHQRSRRRAALVYKFRSKFAHF